MQMRDQRAKYKEYEIIWRLEEVYQSRIINKTYVVLADDCGIDLSKLQRLLLVKHFPLDYGLIIISKEELHTLLAPPPDLVVYVDRHNLSIQVL